MKTAVIIAGIVAALCVLYLFLIFPSLGAKKCRTFFAGKRYYAHRGLFTNPAVPENSLEAFRLAANAGYGIELDLHLTSDGQLVVFHDNTLKRVCGKECTPESLTAAELCSIPLFGTEQRIPLFSEALDAVGSAPLIVELKGIDGNTEICAKTAEMLESRNAVYCIESFNPVYVRWFKLRRPSVIRGQLCCDMKKKGGTPLRYVRDFILENMLLNFLSRPHFLAYDIKSKKRFSFRTAKLLGGFPVAWTVRSFDNSPVLREYGAFIFEGCTPERER